VALAPFAALVALALLPRRAAAEAFDHSPALNGGKSRFVPLDPAKPLPKLKLLRLNGKPVELAAKPGRPMVVNIWATWSQACQTELPKLESLHEARGKDLDIAAIAEDGAAGVVAEPFLRKQGIKHLPVYLDPDGVAIATASGKQLAGPFVRYTTPMSYLITREGLIAGYIAGPVDWTSEAVNDLIAYLMQAA
jgi:thiol-disulfide isomerase/thioredoxin